MSSQPNRSGKGKDHPAPEDLRSFLRGELPRREVASVVRHLLRGCRSCQAVTGEIWSFGEERLRPGTTRQPDLVERREGVWR
jgi:hypothetical protein